MILRSVHHRYFNSYGQTGKESSGYWLKLSLNYFKSNPLLQDLTELFHDLTELFHDLSELFQDFIELFQDLGHKQTFISRPH